MGACVCVPNVFAGKNYTSGKLSLSADSLDSSEATPFIERHRISKSILKKSESSSNYYANANSNAGSGADSDTEKLIAGDNATASDNDATNASCTAAVGAGHLTTLMGDDSFTNVYGTTCVV